MEKVRATRAYLAGFGTAGSLLAGAAFLFVLASAVVSFRGWPQVGDQGSAATVVQAASPRPAPTTQATHVAALVAAALAPPRPRAGPRSLAGPVAREGAARRQVGLAAAPAGGRRATASEVAPRPAVVAPAARRAARVLQAAGSAAR